MVDEMDRAHALAHLHGAARALPAAMRLPLRSQAVAEAHAVLLGNVFSAIAREESPADAVAAVRAGVAALQERVAQAGLSAPVILQELASLVSVLQATESAVDALVHVQFTFDEIVWRFGGQA